MTSETIQAKIKYEDCKKWCLNVSPSPDIHMSFFSGAHYQATGKPVHLQLEMPALRGMVVADIKGREAIVTDLAFLPGVPGKSPLATALVVTDPRVDDKDAHERIVKSETLSKDGSRFRLSKSLDACSSLASFKTSTT